MIVLARILVGMLSVLIIPVLGAIFNMASHGKVLPDKRINSLFVKGLVIFALILGIIFFVVVPCYTIGSWFI